MIHETNIPYCIRVFLSLKSGSITSTILIIYIKCYMTGSTVFQNVISRDRNLFERASGFRLSRIVSNMWERHRDLTHSGFGNTALALEV